MRLVVPPENVGGAGRPYIPAAFRDPADARRPAARVAGGSDEDATASWCSRVGTTAPVGQAYVQKTRAGSSLSSAMASMRLDCALWITQVPAAWSRLWRCQPPCAPR